jgi:hypothetical protein
VQYEHLIQYLRAKKQPAVGAAGMSAESEVLEVSEATRDLDLGVNAKPKDLDSNPIRLTYLDFQGRNKVLYRIVGGDWEGLRKSSSEGEEGALAAAASPGRGSTSLRGTQRQQQPLQSAAPRTNVELGSQ